jgi:dihydroorotate dehydrogenase (NAD+) catalytic subunit
MEDEWQELSGRAFPVNASIYGGSVDEFIRVAGFVAAQGPDFIELNISCPNSDKHGMLFGVNAQSSHDVVAAVKKVIDVPLIAKLTPAAPDIAGIAKACEDAGADAICAINTAGPGMIIDIESRCPVLAFKTGGLSGPMIKPIAVRCVYDIFRSVSIPIIGLGGISTGKDAIEIIMAGATLVGIGTAVRYRGINVFDKVNKEINDWLTAHDTTMEEIRGAAHREVL